MSKTTACCFAGPMHGKVMTALGWAFVVEIPERVDLNSLIAAGPTAPVLPRRRRYFAKRFAFGPLRWTVWLYEDGWIGDESVERHVALAMQTMWEIARAWNGVPVHVRPTT